MSVDVESAKSCGLCLDIDDFISNKPIWVAHLSNELKVYQDDGRPGEENSSAWVRLGNYMNKEPGVSIREMTLRCGSHEVKLPPVSSRAPGYYFSNLVAKDTSDKESRNFIVVGFIIDSNVVCQWYSIPELGLAHQVLKKIEDVSFPFLITNPT